MRLIDARVVTPVGLLVWLIFPGTAHELRVQRTLEDFRMLRLQRNLSRHVIVCGFGSTGASAADCAADWILALGVPGGGRLAGTVTAPGDRLLGIQLT